MIWASAILAIALIVWKALDNAERQAARDAERRIAATYASARADYAQVEHAIHTITAASTQIAGRLQRVEEWQANKSREAFGRGRS